MQREWPSSFYFSDFFKFAFASAIVVAMLIRWEFIFSPPGTNGLGFSFSVSRAREKMENACLAVPSGLDYDPLMTASLSARAIKIESRGGRSLIDSDSAKLYVTLGVREDKSFIDRSLLSTINPSINTGTTEPISITDFRFPLPFPISWTTRVFSWKLMLHAVFILETNYRKMSP